MTARRRSGPLVGTRVVELSSNGPGPFAAMMLSDMGAEVLRVDRIDGTRLGFTAAAFDVLGRGRRSVGIDLKQRDGRDAVLRLVECADVLLEGFRPGVLERLGLGPDECQQRNPRLVYCRMTGWGREGPFAQMAGHDINYIDLSGTLSLFGRASEPPVPPANLLGDYGGGGMLATVGVLAALIERTASGQGEVVDAAMVDGAALLAAQHWGSHAGAQSGPRGTNVLDTGAWYYEVYETKDGRYISFGSLEPQFFAEMVERVGLAADVDGGGPVPPSGDRSSWPAAKQRMAALVRNRTRDEWCALLDGTDACFAPVLSLDEAPLHPQHAFRQTFIEIAGVTQPGPSPRFSRTPGLVARPAAALGEHTEEALRDWGFTGADLDGLLAAGAIR